MIFCWDLIEHLEKDIQIDFLKELNNHLNENGFISIKTINALSPTASFFRYEDFTHKLSYTPITIKFLANNAGFENLTIRPEYQESSELQKLKWNYAEIYRKQFLINDIILTPNIIVTLFKNEETYLNYLKSIPEIKNEYIHKVEDLPLKELAKYYINRIFKVLSFNKINLFNLNNKKYTIQILIKNTDT